MAGLLRETASDKLLKLIEKNNQEMFKAVGDTEEQLSRAMAQTIGLSMSRMSLVISDRIDRLKSTEKSNGRGRG